MIVRLCAAVALVLAFVAPAAAAGTRADAYGDGAFVDDLDAGLHAFYQRDFGGAQARFADAVAREPANTFAIAFLNAAATHRPGALDTLIAAEEDRAAVGRSYDAHVQLGFSYAFAATTDPNRDADARDEFSTAVALDATRSGAHDGLGILREDARSANRAKIEFQTALAHDPDDVLAREYLGLLYQVDLKEPVRALAYMMTVPNLVPGYADIDFHIASALYDTRAPAAAIAYATRGLELDVGHVGEAGQHGFTLLARIYLDRKQLTDARRVLLASIASDADADYATTLLHRLDAGDYGKVTVELPVDDGRCFACGPHNPDGLHLTFEPDGVDGATARVTLPPRLQGYRGIAQGGIVMMLLDEIAAHACRFAGERAMTASFETRFRRPVPIGVELVLRARVTDRRRNVLFLTAAVEMNAGVVLATATGTFVSTGRLS